MSGGRVFNDTVTVGDIDIIQVDADPDGVLTGRIGSLAIRNSAGLAQVYQNDDGATTWSTLGGAGDLASTLLAGNTTGGTDIDMSGSILRTTSGTLALVAAFSFGSGADVTITGGIGSPAGDVILRGGASSPASGSGSISIGSGSGGSTGTVSIFTADAGTSGAGDLLFTAGDSAGGSNGGSVRVVAGDGRGEFTVLTGGGGFLGLPGGPISLNTGPSVAGLGRTGSIDLATGAAADNASGPISLTTGPAIAAGMDSGSIDLTTGNSTLANGGDITLTPGSGAISDGEVVLAGDSNVTGRLVVDGLLYIPSAAGAPVGAPTVVAGHVPMTYDTTNERLYVYNGGWVSVLLA